MSFSELWGEQEDTSVPAYTKISQTLNLQFALASRLEGIGKINLMCLELQQQSHVIHWNPSYRRRVPLLCIHVPYSTWWQMYRAAMDWNVWHSTLQNWPHLVLSNKMSSFKWSNGNHALTSGSTFCKACAACFQRNSLVFFCLVWSVWRDCWIHMRWAASAVKVAFLWASKSSFCIILAERASMYYTLIELTLVACHSIPCTCPRVLNLGLSCIIHSDLVVIPDWKCWQDSTMFAKETLPSGPKMWLLRVGMPISKGADEFELMHSGRSCHHDLM